MLFVSSECASHEQYRLGTYTQCEKVDLPKAYDHKFLFKKNRLQKICALHQITQQFRKKYSDISIFARFRLKLDQYMDNRSLQYNLRIFRW